MGTGGMQGGNSWRSEDVWMTADQSLRDGAGEVGNPWAAAFFGMDNAAREIVIEDDVPPFYLDTAAMDGLVQPQSTLMDIVASSSNHSRPGEMAMVPYAEAEDAPIMQDVANGDALGAINTHGMQGETNENDGVLHCTGTNGSASVNDAVSTGKEEVEPAAKVNDRKKTAPLDLAALEAMFGSLKGMQEQFVELQAVVRKIAAAASQDSRIMKKIGDMIPTEFFDKAPKMVLDCPEHSTDIVMPLFLEVKQGSIGVTCNEVFNCQFGDTPTPLGYPITCMNKLCATNRYPNPDSTTVWDFTKWITLEAPYDSLSMLWFECGVHCSFVFTGLELKDYITGVDFGVRMLETAITLYRTLESERFNRNSKLNIRHFLDTDWGHLVTSGQMAPEASFDRFCCAIPPCQLAAATVVMVPLRLHGRWCCYSIDFEARMVYVLDPCMSQVLPVEIASHLDKSSMVVKECVRCMRMKKGDTNIGAGEWRGFLLVPKNLVGGADWGGSVEMLLECMTGLNDGFVCDTDNMICPTWTRRKLVYRLLNMTANRAAAVALASAIGQDHGMHVASVSDVGDC